MSQAVSGGHTVHAVVLGAPAVLVLAAALAERLRQPGRRRELHVSRMPVIRMLAGSLFVTGLLHLSVVREHFAEYSLFGWFFLGLAVVQLSSAAMLWCRPTRRLMAAALVGNAAVVLLWAQTRFVALPVGPEAGSTESVGPLDAATTGLEVAAVLLAAVVLARRQTGLLRTGTFDPRA
jgi:hypothetical protein